MSKFFLGIDIGGTKSHALIADEKGRVLGFGGSGTGNHEMVGYSGLKSVLKQITHQSLSAAGLKIGQLGGAGIGVAGYDWPSERTSTMNAVGELKLACPLEVVNDTIVGLLAGASEGWGVAVNAGTGENCWGWDRQHKVGRVTGNGGDMGEFGGASSVVIKAKQEISRAWSLRSPLTSLTQAFVRHVGAKDASDLLEGLVLGGYHLEADVAPLVFQIAEEGDEVACAVLKWAGEELASLVIGVIRQLSFEDLAFEVVFFGSLFDGGHLLIEPMRQSIREIAPKACFLRLEAPPVIGGVLLGMECAGVDGYRVRDRLIDDSCEVIGLKQEINSDHRPIRKPPLN